MIIGTKFETFQTFNLIFEKHFEARNKLPIVQKGWPCDAEEETKEEKRELNVKFVSCDLTRDNQNSNLTLAAQLEVSLAPCQKGLQGTFLKGLDFLTMAGFNCKLIYL